MRFHIFGPDTLIVFSVAIIAALIHWYFSNKNMINNILKLLGAMPPDKKDKYHHFFENVVDEISAAAGGIIVEKYIIPTGAMNAFAIADLKGRRVVGVTEGLLSRLSREELQAVVAHEMTHIASGDCVMTTIASSLFGVFSEIIEHFNQILTKRRTKDEEEGFIFDISSSEKQALALQSLTYLPIALPAFIILFFSNIMGQILNMFISREREYRADAGAIKYTRNPLSLATALYKIATHWRGTAGHLSPIFILSPQFNPLEDREDFFANLFSTHPPITRRLQIILDIAHADINQIYEQISSRKIGKEAEVKKTEPVFFVEFNDKWSGPYTILQLQTLDGLSPQTRIRLAESDEIILADSIPALNHFFKVRDEPIWKIRRLCPICRQWLIVQAYEGLYLWRCAYCDGILVERDKLPRIFVRGEKGFNEQIQKTAKLLHTEAKKKQRVFRLLVETAHPYKCPKCGNSMIKRLYSYAYHIEIDECPKCNLIWFDKDELEILQCLIELEEKNERRRNH